MNGIKKQAAIRRLSDEVARRSFIDFCVRVFPGFIVAPHHQLIADNLEKVLGGSILRLMIALPPRHSKSLMVSELFSAFWLAHNPTKQIIHASYAASLSNSFSLKVRAMVRDNPVYRRLFPHMALSRDRQRVDDWELVTGGKFKSIGVTGGITGHGADLFIIDDPHKEGDEKSPAALQAVFDWWNSAARTRLSPGAAVVFPMTRWHPRDLAGRNLELAELDSEADQWDVIKLPALALEGDPLGRAVGDALWPERYSKKDLLAIKAISERYFEALFQQNPKMDSEPLFMLKDFNRVCEPLAVSERFWSFDLASTDKERSDYTAIGQWSYANRVLILHKVYRCRFQWPMVRQMLLKLARLHPGQRFYFPTHSLELLAVQMLKHELGKVGGTRVIKVDQPGDKVARAGVLSDFSKNGIVVVAKGVTADLFVAEHCGFPDAVEHDDFVDMSSVAAHAVGLNKEFSLAVVTVPTRSKSFNGKVAF